MLFPNEVSQLDDDDPPGGDKVEDNIAPFFVPFSSTGRELLSKGADENIEKKSNSKRQTCVAAAERFYSKCKEKEYFQKKKRAKILPNNTLGASSNHPHRIER
jgi:hypothetical protein